MGLGGWVGGHVGMCRGQGMCVRERGNVHTGASVLGRDALGLGVLRLGGGRRLGKQSVPL